jgi:hypothetical protein
MSGDHDASVLNIPSTFAGAFGSFGSSDVISIADVSGEDSDTFAAADSDVEFDEEFAFFFFFENIVVVSSVEVAFFVVAVLRRFDDTGVGSTNWSLLHYTSHPPRMELVFPIQKARSCLSRIHR